MAREPGQKKKHPVLKAILIVIVAALGIGGIALFRAYKQYQSTGTAAQLDVIGQSVPDFTISTTDGDKFTLSDALKEKEVVVLNIFATWCGPCEREFPDFETIYGKYKDKMEILAVSGDSTETMEDVIKYKADHKLSFPMGIAGDSFKFIPALGFPTTMIVDRDGKAVFCQSGAMADAETFEKLVTSFMGDDYDGKPVFMYTCGAYDKKGYVPGVSFKFTADDGTVEELTSGESGQAVLMTNEPHTYKVEVISVPDGYSVNGVKATDLGPQSDIDGVELKK